MFRDKEGALLRQTVSISCSIDRRCQTWILLLPLCCEALKQAMNHPAVVVSGIGDKIALHSARGSTLRGNEKAVATIATSAGDKPYITGVGTSRMRDTAVWIPILSLALRGGIYVECLPGQSPLDEREIEFLTIVAAIAGAAFDRVCSKIGVA